jgi:hypothetical protein
MSIAVYTASADTTITNRLNGTSAIRATASNFGRGTYLEMFGWANRVYTASTENACALIKFAYSASTVQPSQFRLQAFDAANGGNFPADYQVNCHLLSGTWAEGRGTDDLYTQRGFANWISASTTRGWATAGGDTYAAAGYASQTFDRGYEDVDIDVTALMHYLTSSTAESAAQFILSFATQSSAYNGLTKTIWSKQSGYWDRAARLVAYIDDFAGSDERLAVLGNTHGFCLRLTDQYGNPSDYPGYPASPMQFRVQHATSSTALSSAVRRVSPGVYTCSVAVTSSAGGFNATASSAIIWTANSLVWTSTSFQPVSLSASSSWNADPRTAPAFISLGSGWNTTYRRDDRVRLAVSQFQTNMPSTYYSTATTAMNLQLPIARGWWRLVNLSTGVIVFDFATASNATRLSYSHDTSFFDLDCHWLQPGASYRVDFKIEQGGNTRIHSLPGAVFAITDDLVEQYEL